jgi:hypothetical protein
VGEITNQYLQNFILEGKKVLLKKEDRKQKIQIRFNNKDIDGTTKWRVIVDGVEYHTSEINILTHSRTESEFFEDLGEYKHHIVVDAQRVEFNNNEAIIY